MEILHLSLGCKLVTSDKFMDDRGYFAELYRDEWLGVSFKQANMSYSRAGTVRGLHRQLSPKPQGKFVRCLSGDITDVAVHPETGEVVEVELDSPLKALYVPGELLHGFMAHFDSVVQYLCTDYYDKSLEAGVHPLSGGLNLSWKNAKIPTIISPKDLSLPHFSGQA